MSILNYFYNCVVQVIVVYTNFSPILELTFRFQFEYQKAVLTSIIKKRDPLRSLYYIKFERFCQPILGAVKATGVVAAVARSRGKLCAFLNFP